MSFVLKLRQVSLNQHAILAQRILTVPINPLGFIIDDNTYSSYLLAMLIVSQHPLSIKDSKMHLVMHVSSVNCF